MTILRDAAICQLETREKPTTHDEEGRKTQTQAAVRTLDKAVQQDAESGGGAFLPNSVHPLLHFFIRFPNTHCIIGRYVIQ
jgi:hypothetical protein